MTTELLLSADIGTSSLKAALINKNGNILAFYRCKFDAPIIKSKSQNNKSLIWYAALCVSVVELLKAVNQNSEIQNPEIKSICISGNGPTIASEHFVHLWNDSNGTDLENESYKKISPFSLFAPRLLHIKNTMPTLYEKSNFLFSGPEFLLFQLTGNAVTILPEKRFERAYWNDELLENCKIDSNKMPPFVSIGTCLGCLTKKAAEDLGVQENVKVYCGSPDFVAALIGTNTLKNGILCDRAGSSEGLNLCTNFPVSAEGVRTLPSVISEMFNASVLLSDSGKRFSDYKENSEFAKFSFAETTRILLNQKESKGFALMNDIATEIKNGILLLEKSSNLKIESMRATGGQAHNVTWNQFKADKTGVAIEITSTADAELIGNAISAFTAMGEYSSLQEGAENLVKITKIYEPKK